MVKSSLVSQRCQLGPWQLAPGSAVRMCQRILVVVSSMIARKTPIAAAAWRSGSGSVTSAGYVAGN